MLLISKRKLSFLDIGYLFGKLLATRRPQKVSPLYEAFQPYPVNPKTPAVPTINWSKDGTLDKSTRDHGYCKIPKESVQEPGVRKAVICVNEIVSVVVIPWRFRYLCWNNPIFLKAKPRGKDER
jgi:hypothetical protein